jgi:hypothetical protein
MSFIAAAQQSVAIQQTRQRTHRVCPARESDQVHSIAVAVDFHQITVGIQHIRLESRAEGKPLDPRPRPAKPVLLVRVTHRTETRMIVGCLISINFQHRIQLHHV